MKRIRKTGSPPPSETATRNIETMLKLEGEFLEQRNLAERTADWIAQFVGRGTFIVLHVGVLAVWLIMNCGLVPQVVKPFDPFPFNFLQFLLTFEGVLLAAFVLIKQNRMGYRADHRSHLDLQVNLLAEQEATKILNTLMVISRHLGVDSVTSDPEMRELASHTPLEEIARDLDERLGEK